MKLSFTTLGCPDWSFDKILEQAPALGYQGIEIRGVDGEMLAERIAQFQPGVQRDTLRALKKAGIEMCGFGTSVNFHDASKTDEMLAQGKAAIDVCHAMGIPAIRVFGDRIGDGDEAKIIQQVIEGVQALCDYAEGTGVQILLEVHGEFNTLERVKAVAEGVRSEQFGILWDVAHSDKVYGDDFMAFYEPLKPYIRHTHFKDHVRSNGEFKLCRLGEGDIPIEDIVRQLLKDGYDGWFSLEWEKKWHPELPAAEVAYPDFIRIMTAI
ncbi:MAG: TIM barrel protein [Clostridia bacterium]|nr:TIM barrel protein [Clostridia bacterium]